MSIGPPRVPARSLLFRPGSQPTTSAWTFPCCADKLWCLACGCERCNADPLPTVVISATASSVPPPAPPVPEPLPSVASVPPPRWPPPPTELPPSVPQHASPEAHANSAGVARRLSRWATLVDDALSDNASHVFTERLEALFEKRNRAALAQALHLQQRPAHLPSRPTRPAMSIGPPHGPARSLLSGGGSYPSMPPPAEMSIGNLLLFARRCPEAAMHASEELSRRAAVFAEEASKARSEASAATDEVASLLATAQGQELAASAAAGAARDHARRAAEASEAAVAAVQAMGVPTGA